MKRRGKQTTRKEGPAVGKGSNRSRYGAFREWVAQQDPDRGGGDLQEEAERLVAGPARQKDWLVRIWRDGGRAEKERALWVFSRLLPDVAAAFFRDVVSSGSSALWEKERARDLLLEIDPQAQPGEIGDFLIRARECAEAVCGERAPEGGEQEAAPLSAFLQLPGALRAAVASELLDRDPGRAVAFLESALAEQESLWGDVLLPLTDSPEPAAAELIREGYRRTGDKTLRKKIKKLNHQRRARGLPTLSLEGEEPQRGIWSPPAPVPPAGFLAVMDDPDTRMVWVFRQNVPRGVLACTAWLHDRLGMRNVMVLELSRTESEKYRATVLQNPEFPVVEADPAYCAYLLDEAYKRGAPEVEGEAEAYRAVRMLFKELLPAAGAVPPHPVERLFVSGEGGAAADPLERDAGLLDHALLKNWRLEPMGMEGHLERLEEIVNSRIILQPMQKRERTESFYRQVAAEVFSSPETRERWKARARDTAWVLYQKGDEEGARRLAAIGQSLEHPEREIGRHPFWLALVRKTMEAWMQRHRAAARETPSLIVKPS